MRRLSLIIALTFAAIAMFAQGQPQVLPNDPAVRTGKLDNGLTYYIRHNANPEKRAEIYLATHVGAIQEAPDQDGLAHFLEHMCFNGTKNFPDKGILDYLRSIGASFGGNVNASTGVEQTIYLLTDIPLVRETVIDTCILIMHDYAHFVNNDPEEIDKERGVILEEKRSRRTSSWRMYEAAQPYYFGNTKYSTCSIIGTEEQLKTFNPQSLKNFYQTWYHPDMQALIVVGDIDVDYVEGRIRDIFSDIPAAVNPKAKDVITVPGNEEPLVGIITDPEAVSNRIEVLWRHEPMPREYNNTAVAMVDDLTKSVVSAVMSERFMDIAAKADAPFMGASFSVGRLCETSEVAMGNVSVKEGEAIPAFKAFYTEIEKMKMYGFAPDEIQRAKDDILSYYESAAKKADTRKNGELVQDLIDNFFENTPYMEPDAEYEVVKQLLGAIPDALYDRVATDLITDTNMVVLFFGPQKEGAATPSADEFRQAISDVRASDIQANEANELGSEFLDPASLKGGKVKKSASWYYGSTVWTLKNGAKVILRPSDLEKDKISFQFVKDGGKSIIAEEDLASLDASVVSAFFGNCGVAEFSGTDVQKMLSGKNVGVRPFINTLRSGVSGSATPKDIETALQLAYLYYTSPRFDQTEYDQGVNRLKAVIANMESTPNYILQKNMIKTIYGDNPRNAITSKEIVDKANLETLKKAYLTLFNDAAGLTVIICGDFNIDEVKPLVEKYVGSIPKGKKASEWIDPQTNMIPGTRVNDFTAEMQTPQTTVLESYFAALPYNFTRDAALSAAKYILDIRYVNSLREEEGGTYGASTFASIDYEPSDEAYIQVYFNTNPESADKLIRITKEEMDSLATFGPTDEEFDLAVKNLQKSIPESRISNRYWMGALLQACIRGVDFDKEYEEAVNALTKEDIQTVVKDVTTSGNHVEVVMRPKE